MDSSRSGRSESDPYPDAEVGVCSALHLALPKFVFGSPARSQSQCQYPVFPYR